MAAVTDFTIAAAPTWTPVQTVAGAPVTLWNAANELILVRFGGAGDSYAIAPGSGFRVPPGLQTEAQCASGSKTLQVLDGIVPL